MSVLNHNQFANAKLLRRLREALGTAATPVGTALADALGSALEVDLRRSGDPDGRSRLLALSDEQIIQQSFELEWALRHKDMFTLPLGTVVTSSAPGGVEIGGEHFVLDAARPGLFPIEAAPRHAHGPNLDLLRSEIERLTRKLACRRIGMPSPHHVVDTDSRHLLQFPSLVDAGGVVLQRSAFETGAERFCAASPKQIKALAKNLVTDMRTLWSRRREVGARVEAVRRAAEAALATEPSGATIRSIVVDMHHQGDTGPVSLYVEYEAIDNAMREGIVVGYVPDHDQLSEGSFRPPYGLRVPYGVWGRHEEREKLAAAGADGMIDEVALAILNAAPEGATAVLSRLASSYEAIIRLPAGKAPLFAALYWRDGCIRAEVTVARQIDWCGERLDLLGVTLPEAILTALPGRSVSSFVELPFRCDCEVQSIEPLDEVGLRVTLEPRKHLLHLGSGRTWPAPEGF